MIFNKTEYKSYIRQLFAASSAEEFEAYEIEFKNTDKQRKLLQQQISNLVEQIRNEPNEQKQKILSNKLEVFCFEKATTPTIYDFRVTRFATLSNEAKKYACTSALLNKYLTGEIVKTNPLGFASTASGDVIVDINKLQNSHLHELAVDIRDFVHYYFENDGTKVTQAKYFLDLYKNVENIYDLNKSIDKYYDKTRRDLDDFTAGKTDISQEATFARQKLQIVRITGAEGLSFESKHMGHCIRKDRYIEKLHTTAEYYSLRNNKRREPNYPFVTMFFNNGDLVEVVGKSNHAIADLAKVKITRDFIKQKLGLNDNELIHSDKIPPVAKRNLGIVADTQNVYRDLYNIGSETLHFESLPLTAHNFDLLKLEQVHTQRLWLQGNHNAQIVDNINRLASINELSVAVKFNFGDITKLDLSALKVKSLDLSGVNLRNIDTIIFPSSLEVLKLTNVDLNKLSRLDLRPCKKLRTVDFRNSDLRQTNTILFNKQIRNIDVEYAKMSKQLQDKLTNTKRIIGYKNLVRGIFNFQKNSAQK